MAGLSRFCRLCAAFPEKKLEQTADFRTQYRSEPWALDCPCCENQQIELLPSFFHHRLQPSDSFWTLVTTIGAAHRQGREVHATNPKKAVVSQPSAASLRNFRSSMPATGCECRPAVQLR